MDFVKSVATAPEKSKIQKQSIHFLKRLHQHYELPLHEKNLSAIEILNDSDPDLVLSPLSSDYLNEVKDYRGIPESSACHNSMGKCSFAPKRGYIQPSGQIYMKWRMMIVNIDQAYVPLHGIFRAFHLYLLPDAKNVV